MENLSISDAPPPPPGAGGPMMPPGVLGRPPQPQQLPAQMFTTAAQLLDLTDKKLMVALRDGRKLLGILRSWDQYANLVLQSTKERIYVPPGPKNPNPNRGLYADIERGVFLVRGENVLLLGEIDLDKDDDPPPGYDVGELKLVQSLANQRKQEEKNKEKHKVKKLSTLGFEGENLGDVMF
ncbi:U6 snRNA-associated Sm-like protein LSm1 [Diplogelasinospora grovesii]|uniref:U6 snRNA-associated Sm-like protein LSm1 n=1 Tax=Diplogelasinospora grovesii TaxID=303347 RepID=A0AAN6SAY7_9PEZI|nr:U6 snRNA-associated Sm-like protein LSm1 [Diplogelasinospora grovesii]